MPTVDAGSFSTPLLSSMNLALGTGQSITAGGCGYTRASGIPMASVSARA